MNITGVIATTNAVTQKIAVPCTIQQARALGLAIERLRLLQSFLTGGRAQLRDFIDLQRLYFYVVRQENLWFYRRYKRQQDGKKPLPTRLLLRVDDLLLLHEYLVDDYGNADLQLLIGEIDKAAKQFSHLIELTR